jgi:invasion protein IalB
MIPTSLGLFVSFVFLVAGVAWPTFVLAQSAQGPQLLATYGDWGAYSGGSGDGKVCFALAKPASSETNPPNRPRDPAYLFVSTRPATNIRNEVSVIVGYPQRANSEATVEIGTNKYAMQTQNDNAWLKNAAEEPRMVEAMRKGADLVVRAVSSRGTQSTDRYSLKGLAQALDKVAQECK